MTSRLRRWLARLGVLVRRVPRSLATRPDAALRLRLPFVVAYHRTRHPEGPFFFVQVGAFDGQSGDPLHELVQRHEWRGLLIEPQRRAFAALARTYADQSRFTLRNVAIAETSGPRELFKIARRRDDLPDWVEQVASFDRAVLLAHSTEIPDVDRLIEVEMVQCATFAELLDPLSPPRIDLLQIDVEGFDDEVLRLFHDSGYAADIISFEHKHLGLRRLDACYSDLIGRGYRLALDGPDTIAYREAGAP